MAPKRKGPLQTVQREADEIKRQVGSKLTWPTYKNCCVSSGYCRLCMFACMYCM